MNTLISSNTVDGISNPFEVGPGEQITVTAYNLEVGEKVAFFIVALSDVVKGQCGCPPMAVVPATVVDEMPLNCCGAPVILTRSQSWAIIDSPQGVKLRAKLQLISNSSIVAPPTDQIVGWKTTNVPNVNDRMRGCACA